MDAGKTMTAAVIRGADGKISDLLHGTVIEIFRDPGNGSWEKIDSWCFTGLHQLSSKELRPTLEVLTQRLAGVNLAVGSSFAGLVCQSLTRVGINLCRMDDFDPQCLSELAEAVLAPPEEPAVVVPVEIEPGSGLFELDLNAALASNPDLSSKKILRPFFDQTPFLELRLFFDHFPPWLAPELEKRGLEVQTSPTGTGYLTRIFHGNLKCT
ncbi:MAG: hypothetical protein LBT47_03895 [Deltaproteobacteria bacterium]|nr:hypothetical protein [Deltaproteobacteria bacterium]